MLAFCKSHTAPLSCAVVSVMELGLAAWGWGWAGVVLALPVVWLTVREFRLWSTR